MIPRAIDRVKVDPNERPSQMLQRFENSPSDGGTKITNEESLRLQALYWHYVGNDFARLRMLPEHNIFQELPALKKIQELPQFENTHSPSTVAYLGLGNLGIAGIILILLGLAGITVGELGLQDARTKLIDTVAIQLKELEAKKAKGEIANEAYEKERRRIIEKAICFRP